MNEKIGLGLGMCWIIAMKDFLHKNNSKAGTLHDGIKVQNMAKKNENSLEGE